MFMLAQFKMPFLDLITGLRHLFYPEVCYVCADVLTRDEFVLCWNCKIDLPFTNFHHLNDNQASMRLAGRFPFEKVTSLFYFTKEGKVQNLLHSFKYKRKKEIGIFFGEMQGHILQEENWVNDIDLIIPVPLHPAKYNQRGYNQSAVIGRGIAEICKLPIWDKKHLIRTKNTNSQITKSRIDRLDNMSGAFRLQNPQALVGKHILLVDDVLTTGATLEACALELLKVQGLKISIATTALAGE